MTTQKIPATIQKFLGANELGPDEFEADLITGTLDLSGDIMAVEGADKSSGRVPLLWQHNPADVIGVADYYRSAGKIKIKCTLLPPETSKYAALARAVTKADFGMGVSVGAQPTAPPTPIKGTRGVRFGAYRICEASVVSCPADPTARITARNFDAERDARMTRVREIGETTERQAKAIDALCAAPEATAPLTKAQRAAMVEAVVTRSEAPPRAELTGYAKHVDERGCHAFAVDALNRKASPAREDRMALAERYAAKGRGYGLDDLNPAPGS